MRIRVYSEVAHLRHISGRLSKVVASAITAFALGAEPPGLVRKRKLSLAWRTCFAPFRRTLLRKSSHCHRGRSDELSKPCCATREERHAENPLSKGARIAAFCVFGRRIARVVNR